MFFVCFFFIYAYFLQLWPKKWYTAQQRTRTHTKTVQVSACWAIVRCCSQLEWSLVSELQHAMPSATTTESSMMDASTQEQQVQHISVVDDAALQEVLSSMTEPEMNAFLDELNKTGKACKCFTLESDLSHHAKVLYWAILNFLVRDSRSSMAALVLPGIGQTIELLTVPAQAEMAASASSVTGLPTSQAIQSQLSADSVLQELKTLIQQSPADIVPMGMEQKHVQQAGNQKSSMPMSGSTARPSRTTNTYGGTSVVGTGNRPGTAVKSTVTPIGGANIRKSFPQQSVNDDRMFFGRPTSSMPTTIGQGQYHNRTGLMPTHRQQQQQQQQPMAPTSSLGQQQQQQQQLRRPNPSTGFDHQQQSAQRRTLSWFQWVFSNESISPPSPWVCFV